MIQSRRSTVARSWSFRDYVGLVDINGQKKESSIYFEYIVDNLIDCIMEMSDEFCN